MTLLAGAASVYSQSAISMNDYRIVSGEEYGFVEVFGRQPVTSSSVLVNVNGYLGYETMGNSANSYLYHPGTTVYNGASTIGTGYDVGLLGAAGGGVSSYSQLQLAAGSISSTWQSSIINGYNTALDNNYGFWTGGSSVATIQGNSTVVSLAIAVWQNSGIDGTAATLSQAQAYGYEWGVSDIVTSTAETGNQPPPYLPMTLTSFSLVDPVPEPATITLGILGAASLFLRRRGFNRI